MRNFNRRIFFGVLVLALLPAAIVLIFISAGDLEPPPVKDEHIPRLDGAISFRKQIRPILDNHCTNCHGIDDKKAGVDLETSYTSIMQTVRAGDPNRSRLYLVLVKHPGYKPMPLNKDLPIEDVAKVRA